MIRRRYASGSEALSVQSRAHKSQRFEITITVFQSEGMLESIPVFLHPHPLEELCLGRMETASVRLAVASILPRCESFFTLSIGPYGTYPERSHPPRTIHKRKPNPFRISRNDNQANTTCGTDIKDNPPHCPSSAKNHPSSRCGSMRPLSKVSIPPQGISSAPKSCSEPFPQSAPHAFLSKCSLI